MFVWNVGLIVLWGTTRASDHVLEAQRFLFLPLKEGIENARSDVREPSRLLNIITQKLPSKGSILRIVTLANLGNEDAVPSGVTSATILCGSHQIDIVQKYSIQLL